MRYRCAECVNAFSYDISLASRAVTLWWGTALCARHAKYAIRMDEVSRRHRTRPPDIPERSRR